MSKSLIVKLLTLTTLIIASCATVEETPVVTEMRVIVEKNILTDTSHTPKTQKPTQAQTFEPTQLLVITPTLTERQPRPPTPTPKPKIAEQILELYETNSSCEALPCWWGIIPGVTRWEDARIILEPLSFRISDPYIYSEQLDIVNYSAYVFSPPEYFTAFWDTGNKYQIYVVDRGVVQFIKVPVGVFEKYQIPNILQTYGKPEEILLLGSWSYGGHYIITLYMYLPNKSFMVSYTTEVVREELMDGIVSACFSLSSELLMWPKGQNLTYHEMIPLGITDFAEVSINDFMNISEVTLFDENRFFDKFINSELPVCVDIKTDLWYGTNP